MNHVPRCRLYDKELLLLTEKLRKNNPRISQAELAIATGYYSYENGKLIPQETEYFNNLLNFKLNQKNNTVKPGAKPKYRLKISSKETITIGKSYIQMAGLKPNTIMQVHILERGKIILQPVTIKQ